MNLSVRFFKKIFGKEVIKGREKLKEKFEKVFYIYKESFPSIDLENSITKAINAMEFMLNAEVYFTEIGEEKGKEFFDLNRSEFLKHFDYQSIINKLDKNDNMLFLYSYYSSSDEKLSANGVIGRFESIEQFYHWNNPYRNYSKEAEVNSVVVRLRISNNGIIDLPVEDMAYFGKWSRKLELIM
jgi:hypothetical protein